MQEALDGHLISAQREIRCMLSGKSDMQGSSNLAGNENYQRQDRLAGTAGYMGNQEVRPGTEILVKTAAAMTE